VSFWWIIPTLFLWDRLIKIAMIASFWRKPSPKTPSSWPKISFIQPLSSGAVDLRVSLLARLHQDYAGQLEHLWVCDEADAETLALARSLAKEYPSRQIQVIPVAPDNPRMASKIRKMEAALERSTGGLLCFIDDDIAPSPNALSELARAALRDECGAAFGLARACRADDFWSNVMAAFVNGNALFTYVPLATLTEPYTVTGHLFMTREDVFRAFGGWSGMEARLDDDHEIARRVRRLGLKAVQTHVTYEVRNVMGSWQALLAQLWRWTVIPKYTMVPGMTRAEVWLSLAVSASAFLIPLQTLLLLIVPARAWLPWVATMLLMWVAHALSRRLTGEAWPHPREVGALIVQAIVVPVVMPVAQVFGRRMRWRGQVIEFSNDGTYQVVS
jgi:ceramide glucosyltransferase